MLHASSISEVMDSILLSNLNFRDALQKWCKKLSGTVGHDEITPWGRKLGFDTKSGVTEGEGEGEAV